GAVPHSQFLTQAASLSSRIASLHLFPASAPASATPPALLGFHLPAAQTRTLEDDASHPVTRIQIKYINLIMKLGAYPSVDLYDRSPKTAKQRWDVYMQSTALYTGGWVSMGAFATMAYNLSVDRSSLALRERWAKGLARTPRVAVSVALSAFVAESLFFPFNNTFPMEYGLVGCFLTRSLLGGLVASSLGRNPRSAAATGLVFGTALTSLSVLGTLDKVNNS
ncbi:hypothetical protein V2J09_021539, partial [Rumex salicifolius]